MINENNKKAQITIFVIIALIIICAIIIVFVLLGKPIGITGISARQNPELYIEKCIEDSTNEAQDFLIKRGGVITGINSDRKIYYNNTNITYLCYTSRDEELCINEHPMLNKEIEKEIERIIKPKLEKCFEELKKLENYKEAKSGIESLNISILPKALSVIVEKNIEYTKNEQSFKLRNFKKNIPSKVYDFISLSNQIINQELDCDCELESCNADSLGLSVENREFEISKPVYLTEGTEIYFIREILSGKEFLFAIRNCVRSVV